jgi:D-threo-aldose 1-dehydrogenase
MTVPHSPAVASAPTIGLGCAGLMQLPTRRQRVRLISEALHLGINHFDVARFYGLGLAERELGSALGNRRANVTIATKFGIEVSGIAGRLAPLQGPMRAVMRAADPLRQLIRRSKDTFRTPRQFDAASARLSLVASLRALGTDHVDTLFVHGPDPGDAIAVDELREFLAGARQAGLIVEWGVSGELPFTRTLTERLGGTVTQARRTLADPGAARLVRAGAGDYVFGVVQPAMTLLSGYCRANPDVARTFHNRFGLDLLDPSTLAELLIAEAAAATGNGKVVVGTTSGAHAGAALRALTSVPSETVVALRELASAATPPATILR